MHPHHYNQTQMQRPHAAFVKPLFQLLKDWNTQPRRKGRPLPANHTPGCASSESRRRLVPLLKQLLILTSLLGVRWSPVTRAKRIAVMKIHRVEVNQPICRVRPLADLMRSGFSLRRENPSKTLATKDSQRQKSHCWMRRLRRTRIAMGTANPGRAPNCWILRILWKRPGHWIVTFLAAPRCWTMTTSRVLQTRIHLLRPSRLMILIIIH